MINAKRPEVLAPAGDAERLRAAVDFGADAVYVGSANFSMRSACKNFSADGLAESVEYAHKQGVRVYLTLNTLPRNDELEALPALLQDAQAAGVDALIISDLGVLDIVRQTLPDMEIHMSTQTGIVNYAAANMLYKLGARRVILARELSIEDIAEIRKNTPADLAIECFVHGSMCVSLSGRCLLSQYLTGRDANRGDCAQPCRWSYALTEEKRPGEFFEIQEAPEGSYILNSQDLCAIGLLDRLAEAGVDSFKIEGRAKSVFYTAVVTNAYRQASELLMKNAPYQPQPWMTAELDKVSHREYCTGFFLGRQNAGCHYETGSYMRSWKIIAVVRGRDPQGRLILEQRNRFYAGGTFDALIPKGRPVALELPCLYNENGESIDVAPHPKMTVLADCAADLPVGTLLRAPAD